MYNDEERTQTYYNFAVKVFELSQSLKSDLLQIESFSLYL